MNFILKLGMLAALTTSQLSLAQSAPISANVSNKAPAFEPQNIYSKIDTEERFIDLTQIGTQKYLLTVTKNGDMLSR